MANIKRKLENLKPGREYLLTVRAKNTDVNVTSDFTETIRFTVPTDGSIPGVLANFKLYAGLESVMFVFDFSGDKDVVQHEYELYDISQVQEAEGVYQLIENAEPISTGSNGANVFTVTIDNLQIATPNSPTTEGLKRFWGRVRAVDNSGNVGPWTILVQTDDRTPLIDNQYVGSLTASKITAGTIGAHEIILTQSGTPSYYEAPANLAILRSSNYEANKDGWLIRGDGFVEFADANLRGSINASDFNLLDNAATPNVVASLGPFGYDIPFPLSGGESEWSGPDYAFGFGSISSDHALVFDHLDASTSAATPNFSNSSILWSQGDDVRQITSFIGPTAQSSTPYYEPQVPFNPIGATPGYDISAPALNLTSTTTFFANTSKKLIWNSSSLNSGYSRLIDVATGNTVEAFADLSVQTVSDGILSSFTGSYIEMIARLGLGTDSSISGSSCDHTSLISYSYQVNSGSFSSFDGQEIQFSFYGDSWTTGASLVMKADGNFIFGHGYLTNQPSIKISPNRQVTFGKGSGTKGWEVTSGPNNGQLATIAVHETSSLSNATIAIRHSNLGYDVSDGLDITVSRVDGQAFIIQRLSENLNFRTGGSLNRLTIDPNGDTIPSTDNSYTIGNSTNRWQAVYSVNGTIQTSDQRAKTNISDSDLGLEFIQSLRPVKYNYIVGRNIVEKDPNDLEASLVTSIPGVRIHYGLLAQEVKQTLDSLGIQDFGGWILTDINDPNSEQGLRYDQFIAPLINSVKELNQKIETIQNHLGI